MDLDNSESDIEMEGEEEDQEVELTVEQQNDLEKELEILREKVSFYAHVLTFLLGCFLRLKAIILTMILT